MKTSLNRRDLLTTTSVLSAAALSSMNVTTSQAASSSEEPNITAPALALNTSTLRGHDLSVPEQIQVTADAGYDAIEPWIRDLRTFAEGGGKVSDLRKQLEDHQLVVAGAIGFAKWIVDDEAERQAGLDEAKRDMELVRELGGKQMAAPPIGAHNEKALRTSGPIPLETIASRYRELLDVGVEMEVTPLLELWGFSPTISKLSELAYVATESAHDHAAVLPDFYHIYKGGNDFQSLLMIEASRMPLFHINDYPAAPPIETIADKDRVFPGDGVCDLVEIISKLLQNGFRGTFSLELFNPTYWARPANEVAAEGAKKSRDVIAQAFQHASAIVG